jgi:hypothetical protein
LTAQRTTEPVTLDEIAEGERFAVASSFHENAPHLREAVLAHFARPHAAGPQHHIWNYWYVPEAYAYLRADPATILPAEGLRALIAQINLWAESRYGLRCATRPRLSMYVNGCFQNPHNDATNGRMGWVYSLSPDEPRPFRGGETLLFRNDTLNYWKSGAFREPRGPGQIYDSIPPSFNQLLAFDDRIVHAVAPIQGSMDPADARIVLHGHFHEAGIKVSGALAPTMAEAVVAAGLEALEPQLPGLGDVSGLLTLRVHVSRHGEVTRLQTLFNSLATTDSATGRVSPRVYDDLRGWASRLRFPRADMDSSVVIPIALDLE